LHGSIAASLVRVAHQLGVLSRDDLPGQSVAVLQPAARAFLAAFGKPGPLVVDLLLVDAMDHERDRLVKRELRTAVDRRELLPVQCEVDRQDSTGRARSSLTFCSASSPWRRSGATTPPDKWTGSLTTLDLIAGSAAGSGPSSRPRRRRWSVISVRAVRANFSA
jgi:hypothetical protein